jgi:hypothetical protein
MRRAFLRQVPQKERGNPNGTILGLALTQRLTFTERLKFNDPNSVLQKWKASIEPPPEAGQRQSTHGLPIYWTSQRRSARNRSTSCFCV